MNMRIDTINRNNKEQIKNLDILPEFIISSIQEILEKDKFGLLNLKLKSELEQKNKKVLNDIEKMMDINAKAKEQKKILLSKITKLETQIESASDKLREELEI